MSAIKHHYHEEINSRKDDHIDDEYLYSQWLSQSQRNIAEENKMIEEQAERAAFFRTFEATGTYPM
jgi:hypothetical protein